MGINFNINLFWVKRNIDITPQYWKILYSLLFNSFIIEILHPYLSSHRVRNRGEVSRDKHTESSQM